MLGFVAAQPMTPKVAQKVRAQSAPKPHGNFPGQSSRAGNFRTGPGLILPGVVPLKQRKL
jgi:hypothetical protein